MKRRTLWAAVTLAPVAMVAATQLAYANAAPTAASASRSTTTSGTASACSGLTPTAPTGAQIVSVQTIQQAGGNLTFPPSPLSPTPVTVTDVPAYCEVDVVLTHPGVGDHESVRVDLPESGWTGRLQAVGGSAYTAGDFGPSLVQAVKGGYTAVTTDAGVPLTYVDTSWGLNADGQVNQGLFTDFASRAVHEEAVVGKEVTQRFYNKQASYTYWNGCSTGGRQGYEEAQQYPNDFNGILASSPADYWTQFAVATLWPQVVMYQEHDIPSPCVLAAFQHAAIQACDAKDGVKDGVIDRPDECSYDPRSLIGTTIVCNSKPVTITATDADVARKIWAGPTDPEGRKLWYGLPKGADFSGIAGTQPDANGDGNYSAPGFIVATDWVQTFLEKKPGFDTSTITYSQFADLFHQSVREYDSIIGTDNPNLKPFRDAGGKLLTLLPTDDQLIPPGGTLQYRQHVDQLLGGTQKVNDFYRIFTEPGVQHCGIGGTGAVATDPLGALEKWVEHGAAPKTLPAASTATGTTVTRDLCAYPQSSVYKGHGDPSVASSYRCVRHH
jgi:hypothetical protein